LEKSLMIMRSYVLILVYIAFKAYAEDAMELAYFNIRGRAEAIRLTLQDQGVSYENDLVDRNRWINDMKPAGIKDGSLKFGQLPSLFDPAYGTIVQSNAILRYLGRKLRIYGPDHTFTDMVMDGIEDWRTPYAKLMYQDELAPEALEKYKEKVMQPLTVDVGGKKGGLVSQFEAILSRVGGEYFGGKGPSIADYSLFSVVENNLCIIPELLSGKKRLQFWYKTMSTRPNILSYVTSDPEFRRNINGRGIGNCPADMMKTEL